MSRYHVCKLFAPGAADHVVFDGEVNALGIPAIGARVAARLLDQPNAHILAALMNHQEREARNTRAAAWAPTEYRAFRAAYWTDGTNCVLLSKEDQADLPDMFLLAAARDLADEIGLRYPPGEIAIGMYRCDT